MGPNPHKTADLVTFTEEFLYEKHFLCSEGDLKVNNFHYVVNYLNINCIAIYREKCLGIMIIKLSPTICFILTQRKKAQNSKFRE